MSVRHRWKLVVDPNNIKEFSSHLTENNRSPFDFWHIRYLHSIQTDSGAHRAFSVGTRGLSLRKRRQEREADHLSLSNAELIPGAILPFPHTSSYLIKHRDNFYICEIHEDAVAIMWAVWSWNKWCRYTYHWNLKGWISKIDKAFYKKESPYFLWYVYICCRGNVFIEPLPSNDRGGYTQTQSKVIL
jgi:hypothetical protein